MLTEIYLIINLLLLFVVYFLLRRAHALREVNTHNSYCELSVFLNNSMINILSRIDSHDIDFGNQLVIVIRYGESIQRIIDDIARVNVLASTVNDKVSSSCAAINNISLMSSDVCNFIDQTEALKRAYEQLLDLQCKLNRYSLIVARLRKQKILREHD